MSSSRDAAGGSEMTAEEAKLYDRQLRIFGMAAQQRLKQGKVLITGARGMAGEICKNLVLAGVGHVTILAHGKVKAADCGANFFLRPEDIDKPRGKMLVQRVKDLNPNVHVHWEDGSVSSKSH
eukprot:GABV01007312.1.p1 GENE.GABV01007312.1~~GABV01007312.1.p1  ORF type:complete len:123 (-),score=40.77 GABV01007312.1:11-379(-)